MIILLTIIFLIITVLVFWFTDDIDFIMLPTFILCVFFCICLYLGISVKNGAYLDEKINMYQEENNKIENDMDLLIKQYMNYESDTYKDFKEEDSIALVSLYPDLKSNTLVEKQIEVYTNNNAKIKQLKENKIDIKAKKWWLYFGK